MAAGQRLNQSVDNAVPLPSRGQHTSHLAQFVLGQDRLAKSERLKSQTRWRRRSRGFNRMLPGAAYNRNKLPATVQEFQRLHCATKIFSKL